MELLKEYTVFDYDQEEAKASVEKNNGRLILRGILQRADALNQNGRVYPAEILMKEVENYKKLIREDRAFGELDHIDSPIVNLKNACHMVREITVEGNTVRGAVEILDTPCGEIIKAIVKVGGKPGISSRALGSVKKVGDVNVVQDDLQLICWDFVSEPSVVGAFMMQENKHYDATMLKRIFNRSDRVDRVVNELLALKR